MSDQYTTELYHVRHLCACGANISHSQGAFDAHKNHGGFTDLPIDQTTPAIRQVKYCQHDLCNARAATDEFDSEHHYLNMLRDQR